MDKHPIHISVIIPVYNGEKYLKRAIDSVLTQTYPADELIVVDDGSTDNTQDIVKSYGTSIHYIYQTNAGAGAARNHGIRESKTSWISFLDSDDEWLPHKLERQTDVLSRNNHLVWLGSNFYRYSSLTGRRYPRGDYHKAKAIMKGQDYFEDYFTASMHSFGGWTGTYLIHRDILFEAGLFDETFHQGEDLDLWWRIAYRHPIFGYVPEPLAIYHIETESSLMREQISVSIPDKLFKRHIHLSKENGQYESFRPLGKQMLRIHIRSMLFDQRKEDILFLLKEFRELFPFYYRFVIRLLVLFPAITSSVCFGISRFIRFFNLRRQVVPHPSRSRKSR